MITGLLLLFAFLTWHRTLGNNIPALKSQRRLQKEQNFLLYSLTFRIMSVESYKSQLG